MMKTIVWSDARKNIISKLSVFLKKRILNLKFPNVPFLQKNIKKILSQNEKFDKASLLIKELPSNGDIKRGEDSQGNGSNFHQLVMMASIIMK